ncbi:hypothetical protein [Bradyrhizobium symbiodeficiens]|uniref:hypothetical protein n=1 Tax=Bradyrhizobium symbiodeficiens TaxID=1404367 RepID=UPI002FE58581
MARIARAIVVFGECGGHFARQRQSQAPASSVSRNALVANSNALASRRQPDNGSSLSSFRGCWISKIEKISSCCASICSALRAMGLAWFEYWHGRLGLNCGDPGGISILEARSSKQGSKFADLAKSLFRGTHDGLD